MPQPCSVHLLTIIDIVLDVWVWCVGSVTPLTYTYISHSPSPSLTRMTLDTHQMDICSVWISQGQFSDVSSSSPQQCRMSCPMLLHAFFCLTSHMNMKKQDLPLVYSVWMRGLVSHSAIAVVCWSGWCSHRIVCSTPYRRGSSDPSPTHCCSPCPHSALLLLTHSPIQPYLATRSHRCFWTPSWTQPTSSPPSLPTHLLVLSSYTHPLRPASAYPWSCWAWCLVVLLLLCSSRGYLQSVYK